MNDELIFAIRRAVDMWTCDVREAGNLTAHLVKALPLVDVTDIYYDSGPNCDAVPPERLYRLER